MNLLQQRSCWHAVILVGGNLHAATLAASSANQGPVLTPQNALPPSLSDAAAEDYASVSCAWRYGGNAPLSPLGAETHCSLLKVVAWQHTLLRRIEFLSSDGILDRKYVAARPNARNRHRFSYLLHAQ